MGPLLRQSSTNLSTSLKREHRALGRHSSPSPPHDGWRHLVIYLQITLDGVSDVKVAEGIITPVSDFTHVFHSHVNKQGKVREIIA
ncbi:hypothetical protein EVAR_3822_1 [Eumeta japonica]|uniref:Uncharacterized protein n=1 Tax=Eumeta variegata TaxID=151549 RepID=A0A4C1SS08_EUMVA|nr:hypothetical protein EVAR_3822_1 [Eumeta japonica]